MRLFIATTLDGFIAGPGDDLGHLQPFEGDDYGYDAFTLDCDAVVLGRRTFERIVTQHGWTYPPHLAGYVLSRGKPAGLPAGVTASDDLAAIARRHPRAFLDGGAAAIASALALGLVRSARIFTLPVRIGRGIRLWPDATPAPREVWRLEGACPHPSGVLEARYRIWSGSMSPASIT